MDLNIFWGYIPRDFFRYICNMSIYLVCKKNTKHISHGGHSSDPHYVARSARTLHGERHGGNGVIFYDFTESTENQEEVWGLILSFLVIRSTRWVDHSQKIWGPSSYHVVPARGPNLGKNGENINSVKSSQRN